MKSNSLKSFKYSLFFGVLFICIMIVYYNEFIELKGTITETVSSSRLSLMWTCNQSPSVVNDRRFQDDPQFVSVDALHKHFQNKAASDCQETCHEEDPVCNARTLQQWQSLEKLNKTEAIPLFSENEFVFPWEKEYLRFPSLQDIKTLPDKSKSKIYLLSKGKVVKNQHDVRCKEGEKLRFRVDLVDSYGHRRRIGGDEVRAWITDLKNSTYRTKYAATGSVQDLGNGSYVVMVTPLWAGFVQLNIAMVYPREYIRTVLHHGRAGGYWFLYGTFQNSLASETTLCHGLPNIPGRKCICNFTEQNSVPFYCGKPSDERLSCQDFNGTKQGHYVRLLTAAEELMAGKMSRPAEESLIPHRFKITSVRNAANLRETLPPCSNIDRQVTWKMDSPRGFWNDKNTWTSLMCQEVTFSKRRIMQCLKGTQTHLLGDSNVDMMKVEIFDVLGCNTTENICHLKGKNVYLSHRRQAAPMFSKLQRPTIQTDFSDLLDTINSTETMLIVLHHYLHDTSAHLSILFLRLRRLRDSISALIARNPLVLVGLRGPHVITVQRVPHEHSGDVLARFVTKMYYDVFKPLKKHIVFLDGWDMTTAIANRGIHPVTDVAKALIGQFLSFHCV